MIQGLSYGKSNLTSLIELQKAELELGTLIIEICISAYYIFSHNYNYLKMESIAFTIVFLIAQLVSMANQQLEVKTRSSSVW